MKAPEKYTDKELIAALGDPNGLNKAILFLYREYSVATCAYLIGHGASEQDAEDVFQETVLSFIEVVKKGKYRQEASIRTFLVSVARNIWLNDIKKKERAGIREKNFELGRDPHESDISHDIGDRERKRQLRQLLSKLGEPCKKLLTLYYYENLSMKELVEHLPYENEQVVRNKKYKCLQQLTGMIKENPAIAAQIKEIVK